MDGSLAALFGDAVWTAIWSAFPILISAMLVGFAVGVLQTATSIQEQTLSFVPKILVVMLTTLFLGPFLFRSIWRLTVNVLGNLETFVK